MLYFFFVFFFVVCFSKKAKIEMTNFFFKIKSCNWQLLFTAVATATPQVRRYPLLLCVVVETTSLGILNK